MTAPIDLRAARAASMASRRCVQCAGPMPPNRRGPGWGTCSQECRVDYLGAAPDRRLAARLERARIIREKTAADIAATLADRGCLVCGRKLIGLVRCRIAKLCSDECRETHKRRERKKRDDERRETRTGNHGHCEDCYGMTWRRPVDGSACACGGRFAPEAIPLDPILRQGSNFARAQNIAPGYVALSEDFTRQLFKAEQRLRKRFLKGKVAA